MRSKGKERIAKELELCVCVGRGWQWGWGRGRGGEDMLSLVPHNHPMRLVLLPPVTLEHIEA